MDDAVAILLKELSILECSAVDAPANQVPGWVLMKGAKKSDQLLARAIGGEPTPARKTGFACAWGEEGSDVLFAVSHEDAPAIRICKRDGTSIEVRKDALDPDAGSSADVTSSSALPESSDTAKALREAVLELAAYEKHHSRAQMRDALGKFRASKFRRAQGIVKNENFRFF